ncbi:hypothetical protein FRC11_008328, partial [Ceratobasidium sp. 423]
MSDCKTSLKYANSKHALATSTPLEKSLWGLSDPIIPPKLLDSTRLEEPGGGGGGRPGLVTKPAYNPPGSVTKYTYATAVGKDQRVTSPASPRQAEGLIIPRTSASTGDVGAPWTLVSRKKGAKQHRQFISGNFKEPNERYQLPTQKPGPIIRNPTAGNQLGQGLSRKKPRRKKAHNSLSPSTHLHPPKSPVQATPEPAVDHAFLGVLQ